MAIDSPPPWLATMREITGMLETPGTGDNPKILAMAKFIGETFPEMKDYCDQYTHDSIAWCGLTIAYCMAKNGIRPVFGPGDTGKFLYARAWKDFGTKLAKPKLGCVMVFTRDGGGHVSLYEGEDANNYSIRGGNQSDSINVIRKSKADFIGAVWPEVVVPIVVPDNPASLSPAYLKLKPEYDRLLATMEVTKLDEAMVAAKKVIKNKERYIEGSQITGVPWPFIGVRDLRESDCDPTKALGQGDPWNKVSINEPSGKGPFKSWIDAYVFYEAFDHMTDDVLKWDMSLVCWKGEKWNGMGYRNHGVFTPYLWAWTNHQQPGRYAGDNNWQAGQWDTQPGIIAVLYCMNLIDASNYIGTIGDIVPSPDPPPPTPIAGPFTLDGVMWIQSMLNILMPDSEDLVRVDGNYGRNTTAAVRNFQARLGLEQDGDAGDLTCAAMDRELAKIKK